MAGPFDFTGQNIEDSYQRVLQTDGTLIYDGTGSLFTISGNINTGSFVTTGSFNAYTGSNTSQFAGTASFASTASFVQNAQTASYILNAQTASFILNAVSSSFASTASYVQNAVSASYVLNAVSSSFATTASFAVSASRAVSSSFASTASFAVSSSFATTASFAVSSSFATTASVATILQTARTIGGVSFNGSANINLPGVNTTGNQNTSGNAATATIATLALTANLANAITVEQSASAAVLQATYPTVRFFPMFASMKTPSSVDSYYFVNSSSFQYILGTNTLTVTSSYANQALSSSFTVSSSFATTASYFSGSISNAINATSASFASTASFTPNALVTASVSSNTITFTKGNGTTFPITVNTGSGGGGGGGAAFPYTGSATILGSLVVSENIIGGTITSLDTNNRTLQDTLGQSSINWAQRVLYNPSGSTTAIDWSNSNYLSSNVYQRDFKSAGTQNNVSATVGHAGRSYMGDVIEVDGSTTIIDVHVTNGMLVFLHPAGIWYPVKQAEPGATCLLGIATNVVSGTGWVFLEGHVVIDDTSTSGPYVRHAGYGLPVYIEDSTTTGTMSTDIPTTTGGPNIVRVLGHCYQQNTGTATQWMMKFRPSNDWVEI